MWFDAGDIVRVRVNGFIEHEGIMTETGRIISNSRRRGRVVEETASEFAGGRKIEHVGRLSGLSGARTLANARLRLGRPYDAFNYNCQHFVRECSGLRKHSPQKKLALGAAAALALLAIF
ncbi:MAG: hypothetical protein ACSHXY_12785 [Alphaproteobacteria bacterium]